MKRSNFLFIKKNQKKRSEDRKKQVCCYFCCWVEQVVATRYWSWEFGKEGGGMGGMGSTSTCACVL